MKGVVKERGEFKWRGSVKAPVSSVGAGKKEGNGVEDMVTR